MTNGVKTLGSTLSGVASTGLKALSVGIGSAATGLSVLTKNSVDAFASYEQLTGGVETLFKTSGEQVMQYANNAYQTAGLSANAYMDTVTSFSASLISSLNGDTAAAAEKANGAITDMSDNANKMGTDMESIQNAYQGFAKQNYTMLDNLKLGYGGTKEEMERLLADAEKISGVHYDISSFADITDAIHIIQTEMDITGTTAKEAATTVEGSINMTKAAWENLVTGLGDKNADLDGLIDNFVASTETMLTNLLPVAEKSISGIGDLVVSLSPIIAEKLPGLVSDVLPDLLTAASSLIQGLITGIVNALPALIPVAVQVLMELVDCIIENLPLIVEAATQIIIALVLGIAEALPELVPKIVEVVLTIVETLINNIDLLVDAAIQLMMGLAEGLIEALPILIEKAPLLIVKLQRAVIDNAGLLAYAAGQLIVTLAVGLIKCIPTLVQSVPTIVTALFNALTFGFRAVGSIGTNLVIGLWEGIKNAWTSLVKNVSGLADSLLDSVKSIFGIHSPSKEFGWIGQMCVAGLDEPLEEYNPYDTVSKSFKANPYTLASNFAGTSRAIYTAQASMDYGRMAGAMVTAFERAGFKVEIGRREFGRIVREVMA